MFEPSPSGLGGSRQPDRTVLAIAAPLDESKAGHLSAIRSEALVAVKGAPEVMLQLCIKVWSNNSAAELTDDRRHAAEELMQAMAHDGLRVLAVAERRDEVPDHHDDVGQAVSVSMGLRVGVNLGARRPALPGQSLYVGDHNEASYTAGIGLDQQP